MRIEFDVALKSQYKNTEAVSLSNYSIIRVTLNTELDTLWMSPMFSEMAGQNVTNGTFPKTLGPKASTYVGYTVIQVLM